MDEPRDLLRLTIGPLRYEFRAHDAWGAAALARLRAHVVAIDLAGPAHRILHVARLPWTPEANEQVTCDWLMDSFAALLPEGAPRQGWRVTGDETLHLTFLHDTTDHSLFISGALRVYHAGPFQLPWPALLADIIAHGGGILHGGLIAQGGQGLIVTAPPGGGKTTLISRLPDEFQVYADDACLVWPGGEGKFLASPLPTWSVLLGRGEALPAISRWQIGTAVTVGGIILLNKGNADRLAPLPVLQAVLPLYQALSEHPRVVTNRDPHRIRLFDVARGLAGAAPAWRLDATLHGQTWEVLAASR